MLDMSMLFWGLTISVIGKAMLAAGVLWAHSELAHEGRVDQQVLKSFRLERVLTLAGLALIVGGYALEIIFYGFTPFMACGFEECGAVIQQAVSR